MMIILWVCYWMGKRRENFQMALLLSFYLPLRTDKFNFWLLHTTFFPVTADWLSICSLTKTIDLKLIGACSRNCSWWKSLSTDNFPAFRGGRGSFVFSLKNNLVNYVLSSNHKPLILFFELYWRAFSAHFMKFFMSEYLMNFLVRIYATCDLLSAFKWNFKLSC